MTIIWNDLLKISTQSWKWRVNDLWSATIEVCNLPIFYKILRPVSFVICQQFILKDYPCQYYTWGFLLFVFVFPRRKAMFPENNKTNRVLNPVYNVISSEPCKPACNRIFRLRENPFYHGRAQWPHMSVILDPFCSVLSVKFTFSHHIIILFTFSPWDEQFDDHKKQN